MIWRRWCTVLGTLLVALSVAAPAAADGERRPQGETGSSKVQVHRAQPAPPPPPPPPRVAVPRSESDRGERQPRAEPDGRRGDRSDGRWSHYPYYRGRYSWYPWGWWGGWWGGWGPWYYPGYYPGHPAVAYYPERLSPTMGAVDLDVRPEKAQVWLDGAPIGVADNFDGWPRYLWLEQGTYDLVFYHPGYETLARQYTIYPGVVIDVEDRMQAGEAVRPEDLVSTSTDRRDERLRRRVERGEDADGRAGEPYWRDRVRRERRAMEDEPYVDARVEPARLHLRVRPADAAIYLDGRFLGAADEIGTVRAGLIVDPGEHELEVVRPGYASEVTTFTAEAGEDVELTVELEEAGR